MSPANSPRSPARLAWIDRTRLLNWLQIGLVVGFLFLGFRARGRPFHLFLLCLAVPALRCWFDPAFRAWLLERGRSLWSSFSRADASPVERRWAVALLVVLPSLGLFLSTQRTYAWGDSWPVLPTACNFVLRGSPRLDEMVDKAPAGYRIEQNQGLPYCTVRTRAGVYSSYPSGMVAFAVPTAAVARAVGADLDTPKTWRRLEKWTAAWLAALTCGLFFLVAVRFVDPLAAALTTAFLACSSAFFSTTSQGLWQHGGAVFWSLLLLYVEISREGQPGWKGSLLQGLAASMMLACRLSSMLFLLPFGVWVLLRDWRRGLAFGFCAGLFYLPWLGFHLSVYGRPFGPSTGQLGQGQWLDDPWGGLLGVLVSPARGLLVYQPWVILAVVGLVASRFVKAPSGIAGWRVFCLVAVLAHLALVASWNCWWGGHCWGSRLLSESLPTLALLCLAPVAYLLRARLGRVALVAVLLVGFALHGSGMYREVTWEHDMNVDNDPKVLWSWPNAPFLHPSHS